MTRARRPERVARTAGTAALALAVACVVLQAAEIGGWPAELRIFRACSPLLGWAGAVLCWRAAARSTATGGRWCWRLLAIGQGISATSQLASTYQTFAHDNLRYPIGLTVVQLTDLLMVILALAAVLCLPARTAWSSSRLRLGLDMAIVLLAGAVFLWYCSIAPALADHADVLLTATTMAQGAVGLVALFGIARLLLAGVAGVHPAAMTLLAAAGVAEFGSSALIPVLQGTRLPHLVLAIVTAARALLIAGALVQITAAPAAHTRALGRSRAFSPLPYAAVAATYALLIVALTDRLDGRAWTVLGGAITLTALVAARQFVALRDNARLVAERDTSLRRQQQMIARGLHLAEAGTALLTTRDAHTIRRLAVTTALTLLPEPSPSRSAFLGPDPDDPGVWTVLDAAGHEAAALLGAQIPEGAVAPSRADGAVAAASHVERMGLPVLDRPDGERCGVVLLPVAANGRVVGLLLVESAGPLPPDARQSLETLQAQVALALGAADLTAALTRQATHDPLTGLGNRALLRERLGDALTRAQHGRHRVVVMLLDLDDFKPINDNLGHDIGDELLKIVATRLLRNVPPSDLVIRLGGDEFVILAEDLGDPGALADRIIAELAQPATINGCAVRTGVSIGICVAEPGQTPEQILRHADQAMYAAKRRRTGHFAIHRATVA
ncbi:diguanylate cyclase domain-containing protein [Dactylosporangium sp. CA-052675]|uniref:diguanylate cyclase domain-containing protein n=1 Tax=Dactylosporangium sp. CA-052675 TaxID=3239927 RepID=UPI003D94993E